MNEITASGYGLHVRDLVTVAAPDPATSPAQSWRVLRDGLEVATDAAAGGLALARLPPEPSGLLPDYERISVEVDQALFPFLDYDVGPIYQAQAKRPDGTWASTDFRWVASPPELPQPPVRTESSLALRLPGQAWRNAVSYRVERFQQGVWSEIYSSPTATGQEFVASGLSLPPPPHSGPDAPLPEEYHTFRTLALLGDGSEVVPGQFTQSAYTTLLPNPRVSNLRLIEREEDSDYELLWDFATDSPVPGVGQAAFRLLINDVNTSGQVGSLYDAPWIESTQSRWQITEEVRVACDLGLRERDFVILQVEDTRGYTRFALQAVLVPGVGYGCRPSIPPVPMWVRIGATRVDTTGPTALQCTSRLRLEMRVLGAAAWDIADESVALGEGVRVRGLIPETTYEGRWVAVDGASGRIRIGPASQFTTGVAGVPGEPPAPGICIESLNSLRVRAVTEAHFPDEAATLSLEVTYDGGATWQTVRQDIGPSQQFTVDADVRTDMKARFVAVA